MSVQLLKFPTPPEAAVACGADVFAALDRARSERGMASLAVSGGSTPRIMFEWMAKQPFEWRKVELFWVDERCVPPDDAQSNYRMTRESLLGGISIDPRQVHRVQAELTPDEAAIRYANDITGTLRLAAGELPVFDVLQRGMGPDKHTASLFPGEPLIANRTGVAAAVWVEKFTQHRVTLLPGVLERARRTVCLVTGSDKADALHDVLHDEYDPIQSPSQLSSPEMVWFLDEAAAARL